MNPTQPAWAEHAFLTACGIALALAVLAWCEPEPSSPPDSILMSDYASTLGARP